jgi:septal ring factor EnvC (AmiA/AmiB activator)
MKRDVGIILAVVLAVILGGLAGALTGRSERDGVDGSLKSEGRMAEISGKLLQIEKRLDTLESSKLKFNKETEIESKISAIVDRLSKLEQKSSAASPGEAKSRPGLQPTGPKGISGSKLSAVAQPENDFDRRKVLIEKQYESRKKYLDRQIDAVNSLAKRSKVELSDSQKSALKETLIETFNRKMEFDISCIDDPERARERSEEYKRIGEDEDNAVKALLGDEQYKAYSRYFKRSSGPRRRGGRRR